MSGAIDRRSLIAGLASVAAVPAPARGASARVVVVGGGYGGATAARYLKQSAPELQVILVEQNPSYYACPFSNLVIGGVRNLEDQRFSYSGLARAEIEVIHDTAVDVDPASKAVRLAGGQVVGYDRLILAPGIEIRWDALEGYSQDAADLMPHAWKAGRQTRLLREQLEGMPDGGLVVISAPRAPFRCPPGPYERASLIAHYLKTFKPRSKLLVLDAKDTFSKQPLFLAEWAERYPDTLEWRGASDDGQVTRVAADNGRVYTEFEQFAPDVANIIPPQQAGRIAHAAGVADATGWCPIDATTFESRLQPGIHVVGDATIAAPMPKSAFSANLQGKICALQVAHILRGGVPAPTVLVNTCYSYVAPDAAISIVGAYTNAEGRFQNVAGAGGISPGSAAPGERENEANQAVSWFRTINSDVFG